MLPQHFEPFNLQDNRQLGVAFKKGKLPYLEDKGIAYNSFYKLDLNSEQTQSLGKLSCYYERSYSIMFYVG